MTLEISESLIYDIIRT